MTYTLRFDHLDGDTRIRPLAIDGDTTADLAQAVHRHARGYLGSRRVDVQLDPDTLAGSIVSHGVIVGEFTLEAVETEPATDAADEGGIKWGYTLHDLQRLARAAALNTRFLNAGAWHDYYDEALSAIFMQLTASDDKPHRGDLLHAADTAIIGLVRGQRRDRGYREGNDQFGIKWHPQFFRYWHREPGTDFAERTTENLAVHQILAALPQLQQDAVVALAACGHYDTAAEALGITVSCLKQRLMLARRAFLQLWHYPETPGERWRQDRRRATNPAKDVCGNGHEYTPETTGYRAAAKRRGERYCKACSRASRARSSARKAVAA